MTSPMPWLKKSMRGFTIASIFMTDRIVQIPRGHAPLGIKDGLNPSRVRVPEQRDGVSAYDFVWELIALQRHRHPNDTPEALMRRFEADQVIIGPRFRIASPDTVLHTNDDVWFYRIPAPEPTIPYSCTVVYEDDTILVADKPPFLATMPRGKHITNSATVQLRRSTGIDELSPAHRLDRLTSGLLLFTKHKRVRGAYQTLFSERNVRKTYVATAQYNPSITPGTVWRSHMTKTAGEIQGHIIDAPPNAETFVATIERIDAPTQQHLHALHGTDIDLARYTLKPHTGKTHQLRLHMLAAGVPILGDTIYPTILDEDAEDYSRPMHLTSTELGFIDPLTGRPRLFTGAVIR
ncbi:Ribosomal large subunit pseudouridine synthase A [Corynebacterium diphtheriae subsp. lausannense]|nr:Ribosomal large subunit pseudouridine synthase A [Corynebacterium diphtheriae subsp. lausannense]